MISLKEAHRRIGRLQPLQPVPVILEKALGLVCAEQTCAMTSCPTVDSSLKDGFAVISEDIAGASPGNPVTLAVTGALSAGDDLGKAEVTRGTAVRIMTGAPLPEGATAVLASEFSTCFGELVTVRADAQPGRNIIIKASDILQGQVVTDQGDKLTPARLGLLSAAGVNAVSCYRLPRVVVAATGSELVWPGEAISPGKVAASNMVTATAELQRMGISPYSVLLRDNLDLLHEQFSRLIERFDVLITCGGILDGDKDLTMQAMENLGMEKIFHRVRIGPGKGACMGRIGDTTVFNLPGGPPSNHVSLLLLALPGVRRLMGFVDFLPAKVQAHVTKKINGQQSWTQLLYSKTRQNGGILYADPVRDLGRLDAMAAADSLVEIPEGCSEVREGSLAGAWLFR